MGYTMVRRLFVILPPATHSHLPTGHSLWPVIWPVKYGQWAVG